MTAHDPLTLLVLNSGGVLVRGLHSNTAPPIPPALAGEFLPRHTAWRTRVLSAPAGFDGERAILKRFSYDQGVLSLATGYRSYTEGLALRDSLQHARMHRRLALAPQDLLAPRDELCWGMSLTCYILLPQNHVLCAERDSRLFSLPGAWTCSHTEIIEPTDVDQANMQPLLERLVNEELPALTGLGSLKFVGLGLRTKSYLWQLVGILDLRQYDIAELTPALLALQPDAETASWGVYPLKDAPSKNPYPDVLHSPANALHDLEVANYLNCAVPVC